MIRRPPRSTRTDTPFPTRRSSDLTVRPIHRGSNAHGNIKRFFVLIVDQLMNGFAEVAFVQRARQKTQAGAPPSGIVENVPCNGFAFPAGVGPDYDFSGLFNPPGNCVGKFGRCSWWERGVREVVN